MEIEVEIEVCAFACADMVPLLRIRLLELTSLEEEIIPVIFLFEIRLNVLIGGMELMP